MNKTIKGLLIGVAVVIATGAGYFAYAWRSDKVPSTPHLSADALFNASFKDMSGQTQPLAQWRGKVVIVNFWATWCPPCRTEIPAFIKLQDKYGKQGLVFVGIAIDQKDKVQAFADDVGINYPSLLGELDAIELAKVSGNRLSGLPYTAVVNRQGSIVATELGGVTEAKLEPIIKSLL